MSTAAEAHDLVVDLETTTRCPIGNNKANPHWVPNEVVVVGKKTATFTRIDYVPEGASWRPSSYTPTVRVLVGHNLAFDLQYFIREGLKDAHKLTIWDTALAEYVLSGQESVMPSLDFLCEKYGLPVKDGRVKAYWDMGKDTRDIPKSLLLEYCEQDVNNTYAIYQQQLLEAFQKGVLNLIFALNDCLLATTHMMWAGMKVDRNALKDLLTDAEKEVAREVYLLHTDAGCSFANFDSPKQVAAILYGGIIEYTTKEAVGVYKSGVKKRQPKFKNVVIAHAYPGLISKELIPKAIQDTIKAGKQPSTDDATLEQFKKDSSFVQHLLRYRELNKQINTYYTPILDLLFPGDFIFHNLNNTVTKTGRLSSSNPNLQNVTSSSHSALKTVFVSRYEGGKIVEADFSQLELVCLAELSQDRQLMRDIRDGVDIHTELYKQCYGRAPVPEERRQFKRATFAMVYGAGSYKISALTGLSTSDSRKFVKTFMLRYPDVGKYRTLFNYTVRSKRLPSTRKDPVTGIPLGVAKVQSPITGRILTFYERYNEFLKTGEFSFNDTCNYPIQSFATGDLVPLFLGKLFRVVYDDELLAGNCVIVNTVHDSVEFDCKPEVVDVLKNRIKEVAGSMQKYVKETFGYDMQMELKVEVSSGPNWADQE